MKIRHLLICAVPVAAAAAQAPKQWRLVEEWRVGGAVDGPLAFDFTNALARLPNGGFVHFNWKAAQLHFLDGNGKPVRSVGRKGQGPGEFSAVNGLVVAADGRVIVSDLAKGFSIFSPTGDFQKAIRPMSPRLGTGGRWQAMALRNGQLVENVVLPGRTTGNGVLRLLWSADLTHADTVRDETCLGGSAEPPPRIPLKGANGQVRFNMSIMYAEPEIPMAYDMEGFAWDAPGLSANTIKRRGLRDCQVAATVTLAGARAPISGEQRALIGQQAAFQAKQWEAVPPSLDAIPKLQAWYSALYVDSQRNLWVQRRVSGEEDRVEVYSPSGQPLAVLSGMAFPSTPIVTETHVYGLVRDSDGVAYLVAYRIVK